MSNESSDAIVDQFAQVTISGRNTAPPFEVPDISRLLVVSAKGVHMQKLENGEYTVLSKGFLFADNKDIPVIVAGNEQDITGRLRKGRNRGDGGHTYTLPLGVGWKNGEMSSLFVIRGGVVEYRKNIGKAIGDDNDYVTGRAPTYMVTYASVGIPLATFSYIVDSAAGLDLNIVKNEKDQINDDYIFMNVNITNGEDVPATMRMPNGSVKSLPLKTLIASLGKNLIGNVGLEFSLKRSKDFDVDTREYQLSARIKLMAVTDTTHIRSPPLSKVTMISDTESTISPSLHQALMSRLTDKPTTKIPSQNSVIATPQQLTPAMNTGVARSKKTNNTASSSSMSANKSRAVASNGASLPVSPFDESPDIGSFVSITTPSKGQTGAGGVEKKDEDNSKGQTPYHDNE